MEHEEGILERYLNGQEPTVDEIRAAIRRGTIDRVVDGDHLNVLQQAIRACGHDARNTSNFLFNNIFMITNFLKIDTLNF